MSWGGNRVWRASLDHSSPQSSGAFTHRHYQAWDQTRQCDLKPYLKILWHCVSFQNKLSLNSPSAPGAKSHRSDCVCATKDNATIRSAVSSRSWYYRSPSSCCASLSHTRTGCGFPVWPVKLTFFAQFYWREDRLLQLFSPEFQTCPQRERELANESETLRCFTRLTLLHFHKQK